MHAFLAELRRRNVFRVAAAYAVVGWVLIEVSDTVLPRLHLPEWTVTFIVVLLILGLPLALFLAWAYELTPEGIKRASEVHPSDSVTHLTGRKLDFIIIGLLAVALTYLLVDKFVLTGLPPSDARPETEAASRETSIAVLPFADMSAEHDQEYFADGLSDEIINLLARIQGLRVTGRTSSFSFKGRETAIPEIASTLGVAHVLEGSVRKSGEQLRITAQLIAADSGFHLWSETFDRRLEDIFVIQDEIAAAIAQELELTLAGRPARGTGDLQAYDLYLRARELMLDRTFDSLRRAHALLDQALERDPDYAPALAAAGEVRILLSDDDYGETPLDQAAAEAQALLARALVRDPDLAEAHAAQGLLYDALGDDTRAETALTRALEINPSLSDALHWRALNLYDAGRLREALVMRRRLAEIDPLYGPNLGMLAVVLAHGGQLEEATALTVRRQRLFPDNPHGYRGQADLLTRAGRLAEAQPLAERALALAPDNRFIQRGSIGWLYFALGDHARVLTLPQHDAHGLALLAVGRAEEAIAGAEERLSTSPGNSFETVTLLRTLSLAGRHEAVLAWYQKRWGSLAAMEAVFGMRYWGLWLAPLAAAQQHAGRHDDLAATLKAWDGKLVWLREQGFDDPFFTFSQANHLALSGEREAAQSTLATAIDAGYRNPLLAREPAFAAWQDDPDFQRQVARMRNLINAERAQLGLEPLR